MSENTSTAGGGIGFCGLLTILFIALKLCGVITWKWIWVLSPFWIGWGVVIAIFLIVLIVKIIASIILGE